MYLDGILFLHDKSLSTTFSYFVAVPISNLNLHEQWLNLISETFWDEMGKLQWSWAFWIADESGFMGLL